MNSERSRLNSTIYKKKRKKKRRRRKKKTVKGLILSNFKLYYEASITKTVWYWPQDKHLDLWNREPR